MALPADFSKIFGATATGGLTPISDVNYSKGWEYVGSNPPTKNDFSYLQNFSDMKSQWIYNYLITTTNAASRIVGTGTNQIPDMSAFTSGTGWQKLPGGKIIQWGVMTTSTTVTASATFPIAFPTACRSVVSAMRDVTQAGACSVGNYNTTSFQANSWSLTDTTTGAKRSSTEIAWIAIGE